MHPALQKFRKRVTIIIYKYRYQIMLILVVIIGGLTQTKLVDGRLQIQYKNV